MRYRRGRWCEAFLFPEHLGRGIHKERGPVAYKAIDPWDENTVALATGLIQFGELHCFRQKGDGLLELWINFKHDAIRTDIAPE